jgi:phage shock protein A
MTDIEGGIVAAEPVSAPSAEPKQNDAKDTTTSEVSTQPELTIEQKLEAAEKAKAAYEKRIARQTAANRDAQRRWEEAQAKLKEYESKAKPATDGAPKQEDFDNYEDYVKAQAKYEAKQEFEAKQAEERQALQRANEAKQLKEYVEKFDKLAASMREAHTDFDEKFEIVHEAVSTVPDGMGKQAFQHFMREAENPAEVAYHLGANPELIEKLQGASPVQIIKELTLLEHGLKGKTKSRTETKTPPITPLKGSGKASTDLSGKSAKELVAWVG